MEATRPGDARDGKIFVFPVEKIYRIRTGEEDKATVTPVKSVPIFGLALKRSGIRSNACEMYLLRWYQICPQGLSFNQLPGASSVACGDQDIVTGRGLRETLGT